jgi:hypothetical protein
VIDALFEKDYVGLSVSVGPSMSPPRQCGRAGATDATFAWVDVWTALGDPDVPVDLGKALEPALQVVGLLEGRLNNLFLDRSLSKVRLAQQNRIARRRAGDT